MECRIFHVDAFTDRLFAGNPACVVLLDEWLPDGLLLSIAAENGLPETAFIRRGAARPGESGDAGGASGADDAGGHDAPEAPGWSIRWFTPDIEMDLCGHATLAAAHVVLAELGETGPVRFASASGELGVEPVDGLYALDFPRRPPEPATLPREIAESLNVQPKAVFKARDYILEYATEAEVRSLAPDRSLMDRINLDPGGVVATAPADPGRRGTASADFVSRFFTPQATIFEDPVTGSAHCSLVPFWAGRLGKRDLVALQLSARGGRLACHDGADRVRIAGAALTFSSGSLRLGAWHDVRDHSGAAGVAGVADADGSRGAEGAGGAGGARGAGAAQGR